MSDKESKKFSIGRAAALCGCTTKQIRNWENQGYIDRAFRVQSGERAFRYFSESDMEVIKKIQFFLDQGFRLPVAAQKAREEILKTGGNQ